MSEALIVQEAQPVAQSSPLAMLASAVERGMSPETIRALMDLQDRMQATEARQAFVRALNAFKADPPEILKTKQVSFGAGKTSYKHATLDNVSGQIGAGLAKVGISHRWETEQLDGGLIRVTCILTHALGHSERVPLQASPDTSGSKNSIQAVGSTVTYLQRYTLLAATGMAVSDQDDDGQGGKGKVMPESQRAEWHAAIYACTSEEQCAELWPRITHATSAAGDVAAHEELRSDMLAKRRALREVTAI